MQTVAWDQRFGRRVFFKAAYLHRTGSHAYTLDPDPRARCARARQSTGESKYWELETTGRYLANEHRDLTRLVRPLARHARSQRLRSVLRQLPEPDHQTERELAQLDRRAASPDRSRHASVCQASGFSRRSTNGAPASRGRPSTSSRTSSARATDPAGCRASRRSTSRSLDRWRFKKYRFTARHQGLQRVRHRQRARRAEQHHRRPTTASSTTRFSARSDSYLVRAARSAPSAIALTDARVASALMASVSLGKTHVRLRRETLIRGGGDSRHGILLAGARRRACIQTMGTFDLGAQLPHRP